MMYKKTALVTGSSRGIGLGIVKCLLREGWQVVLNGVRPASAVTALLEGLQSEGHAVKYVQGSIADPADRKRLLEEAIQAFGQLHALVNNAGVAPLERKDLLDMTEASYDRVMDTNLKGPFFLSQAAANYFAKEKEQNPAFPAYIVNVSSISATVVSINRGEYCISKAGVSMATQLLATRLGTLDIPVYEVRPGVTATDMTAGVQEKYDKLIAEGLCVQPRWGYPEDVGKAVAALLRGDLPYSTGQVIMVDGGLTIPRL